MKMPRFMLRGFSRPSEAIIASLGSLEHRTMNEVWKLKEVSVKQVEKAFGESVAYTTVMTTLDRLYKKGFLTRRKEGRAFLYSPKFTPEELERGLTEDLIESLFSAGCEHIEPVLACIVDAVSDRDRELLNELERLVQEKRRLLESGE